MLARDNTCLMQRNADGYWQCQNPACRYIDQPSPGQTYPDVPPLRTCSATGNKLGITDTAGNPADNEKQYQNLPGTILHDLIRKYIGETEGIGCVCSEWINQMNQWGPSGCRDHFAEICDRLQSVAEEKKWVLQKCWARWTNIMADLPVISWIGKSAQRKVIEYIVNKAIDKSAHWQAELTKDGIQSANNEKNLIA
jgi:hypothetical protein